MKRALITALILALIVPIVASANGKFLKAASDKAIPGSYIVIFKDGVAAGPTARALATEHGANVAARWTVINGVAMQGLSEERALRIADDSRVALVEQDQVFTTNATQSGATWGIDRIDQRNLPLSGTYTYNYDGTGVHAYIVDTGIYTAHSDFGGRAVWDASYANGPSKDCNGHGTHVAGTIGSATYGVAKNVTLHAVKVLNCAGSGSTTGVVNGINYVTNNRINPAVANMSLGGGKSSALDNAVNSSVNSGVFYAVAAGNDSGTDACTKSPAGAAQAYTVGSTTSSDSMSSFSNVGSCVNIFAPGSSITSTWNSAGATNTISGTSMASPHVAGAAALLLDQSSLSVSQIKTTLTNNATSNVLSGIPGGTVNKLLYSIN